MLFLFLYSKSFDLLVVNLLLFSKPSLPNERFLLSNEAVIRLCHSSNERLDLIGVRSGQSNGHDFGVFLKLDFEFILEPGNRIIMAARDSQSHDIGVLESQTEHVVPFDFG